MLKITEQFCKSDECDNLVLSCC